MDENVIWCSEGVSGSILDSLLRQKPLFELEVVFHNSNILFSGSYYSFFQKSRHNDLVRGFF
jgi:hypothetical protein